MVALHLRVSKWFRGLCDIRIPALEQLLLGGRYEVAHWHGWFKVTLVLALLKIRALSCLVGTYVKMGDFAHIQHRVACRWEAGNVCVTSMVHSPLLWLCGAVRAVVHRQLLFHQCRIQLNIAINVGRVIYPLCIPIDSELCF